MPHHSGARRTVMVRPARTAASGDRTPRPGPRARGPTLRAAWTRPAPSTFISRSGTWLLRLPCRVASFLPRRGPRAGGRKSAPILVILGSSWIWLQMRIKRAPAGRSVALHLHIALHGHGKGSAQREPGVGRGVKCGRMPSRYFASGGATFAGAPREPAFTTTRRAIPRNHGRATGPRQRQIVADGCDSVRLRVLRQAFNDARQVEVAAGSCAGTAGKSIFRKFPIHTVAAGLRRHDG
jgi:hypothetical protein